MLQKNLFRVAKILVATMAAMGARKWPYAAHPFASAAKRLGQEGNALAASFHVTSGIAGLDSYEFREMRSLLHQATLISYDSLDHDTFNVRPSIRTANELFRRAAVTDQERADAKALLLAHWKEATGRDWKEEVYES